MVRMRRENFFTLISDLSFDPAEQDQDIINKAIDKRELSWNRTLNDYNTSETSKIKARERLGLLPEIRRIMTPGTGAYASEADDKKREVSAPLTDIANVYKKARTEAGATGDIEIPLNSLEQYVRQFRLSEETVRAAFESVPGIRIVEFDVEKDLPQIISEPQASAIAQHISMLRGSIRPDDEPLPGQLETLYDIARYLSPCVPNTREDILAVFSAVPQSNEPFENTLSVLSQEGRTHFADDSAVEKYDNWIRISSIKQQRDFRALSVMPENDKRNPYIAQPLIDELRKRGFTLAQAVSLYNIIFAELPPESYYVPAVTLMPGNSKAGARDENSANNTRTISELKPCVFTAQTITISGKVLTFNLERPPGNAAGILYAVTTTKSAPAEYEAYARVSPAQRAMTIKAVCPDIADKYYITAITAYDVDGETLYSAPVRREFIRPSGIEVNYRILKAMLVVSASVTEGPVKTLPSMKLIRGDGAPVTVTPAEPFVNGSFHGEYTFAPLSRPDRAGARLVPSERDEAITITLRKGGC